jgi:hypothetical protein
MLLDELCYIAGIITTPTFGIQNEAPVYVAL